ncbi:MAG TPA: YkgJ family cysteine cluster protein [Candidatus Binataceae bacterium]|nr:YkgJ family cysteine cluster protein [Candidatus Binataceae bacterium]
MMRRESRFAYTCNRCGLCCRDQVITLSPYDVLRIARATGLSTGAAVRRYTRRRGSLLRFNADGRCAALDGAACTIHPGRPLACRLYPLGLERAPDGSEVYVRLEPVAGSRGAYGDHGTVADFLADQGIGDDLKANDQYRALLAQLRERINELVDFDRVEPREFWRVAAREALAEADYDPNRLIEALFDADSCGGAADGADAVGAHCRSLERMIASERDPALLAAAGIMLAVSLGLSPRVLAA